jgi:3-hydroxyisobutyrate dehydrogenase-like beta-hydroxyacid dehydrogenase
VLWLSGPAAGEVAALFAGSPFAARVLGPELGTASALKVCFALQSKALPAIWLEVAAAAREFGVEEELRGELARTGVDYAATVEHAAGGAAKAWRWAAEMDEAADTLAARDLPDGFSRAAAELYRRLADGRLHP